MGLLPRLLLILMLISSLGFSENYHEERMNVLKNKGFRPQVIYDIGAHQGSWTQMTEKIFKEAQFVLFEANEIHRPSLQRLSFPTFFAVLGDHHGIVTFYTNGSTGDSVLREQTRYYAQGNCRETRVQMTTLDTIVQENNLPLPDLIKIDVQGAERMIIEGGSSIFCHAEVVILETKILEYNKGAPSMHETIALMDELGYQVLDVLELHYLPTKELCEVDLMFAKKNSNLIKTGILIN